MDLNIWFLYVFTVLLLMSTPGPSQLLMLSNSAAYGFGKSAATAFGDLSANALQMLAAALGLGVLVASSETALSTIKWCGVGYLVWSAVRMVRTAGEIDVGGKTGKGRGAFGQLYLQGFMTSASNPKAVLFFSSLFPQFISQDGNFWIQFLVLSTTYIAIDGMFLSAYGMGAQMIVARLKRRSTVWVNRVGGGLMLLAAIMLGLKTSVED